LYPLNPACVLRQLLAASGPQLFDRTTMRPHLEVLTQLVWQTTTYALLAGRDLYDMPARLAGLLADTTGKPQWRASPSS
jgi:hypothetical protein